MKNKNEDKPKIRPYWHVDAKWIFGILAFFALITTLALYSAMNITRRDFAVDATATTIASLFSREGLDAEGEDIEELRRKAANNLEGTTTPIPDFPAISLPNREVVELAPRELRIALFGQLTEAVYDEGLEGAAEKLIENPDDRQDFINDASLLGIFTEDTHSQIKTFFWISLVITLLLFGAVIYFSAGWGRAVSPGLLLILASWPGAVFGLLARASAASDNGPLAELPGTLGEDLAGRILGSYGTATVLGIMLLLTAAVGKTVQHFKAKNSKKE